MTNDRYFDDFLAREQGAPYAERRGEVSAFWPMFSMPVTPGAVRTEEMWIQGGENGMQWPETLIDVSLGIVRTAHNLIEMRQDGSITDFSVSWKTENEICISVMRLAPPKIIDVSIISLP